MSDPLQERLLGYVLGALDEAERQQVEESLRNDPRLRRELSRAERSLKILEGTRWDYPPPPGLVERTCAMVARRGRSGSRKAMSPVSGPAVAATAASWPDLAMSGTVILVAALLVAPAVLQTRFQSHIVHCQNNLRELGVSLINYSQFHRGEFPPVPSQGKLATAGIFAPTLLREGFLRETQQLICPSSSLGRRTKRIPSWDELQTAGEDRLSELRRQMSGSYGYSLGYTDQRGVYHSTRNLGRAQFALAADAPSSDHPEHQSLNHAGRGQNVLFEDGHVRFTTCSRPDGSADDIFLNRYGLVGAGVGADDAVIGPSEARPLLYYRPAKR